MRNRIITLLVTLVLSAAAMAQAYGYRCWLDNNSSATVATGSATTETAFQVDIASLSPGLHALHVEAWNGDGRSSVRTRFFLKEADTMATKARYWIDNDLTTLHEEVATSGVIEVDASRLAVGLHAVHYQTFAADGTASAVRTRYFLVNQLQPCLLTALISIDGGEAVSHSLCDELIEIDIEGLARGEHTLHVTLLDDRGVMIGEEEQTFTISVAPTSLLSPADITGREDEEVELPLTLDNASLGENVVGVSFTLQLPEGVSLSLDEDDEPVWSFVSERVNKKHFNVTSVAYADGTWGFRIYTTAAAGVIKGSEGAFMNIALKVAAGVEDGAYTITLKDNKLSVKDANSNVSSMALPNATSTLTVENYLLGDVNDDGEIDLSDAIMVTYYSLAIVPSGFILKAADVNGDGEVDLSDAITIIYKSLGVIQSRSMSAETHFDSSADHMTLHQQGNTLVLSLDNENEYLGLQCDIRLPEGVTLGDIVLSESRCGGHTVMWNQTGADTYRVAVFSPSGKPFFGSMGELLSFAVDSEKGGGISVSNMFLVGSDLRKHPMADLYSGATGISDGENVTVKSKESVYDLQGRRVVNPRKGLYLQEKKKYLVK